MKIIEFYNKLPKEVKVFVEYILPSAIITALIDYLTNLKINDVYVAGLINIVLIFLRQIKPRYEERNK
jgi:TM2 domain-containing membrane protein YozV